VAVDQQRKLLFLAAAESTFAAETRGSRGGRPKSSRREFRASVLFFSAVLDESWLSSVNSYENLSFGIVFLIILSVVKFSTIFPGAILVDAIENDASDSLVTRHLVYRGLHQLAGR
jgi:hypothetical protein